MLALGKKMERDRDGCPHIGGNGHGLELEMNCSDRHTRRCVSVLLHIQELQLSNVEISSCSSRSEREQQTKEGRESMMLLMQFLDWVKR